MTLKSISIMAEIIAVEKRQPTGWDGGGNLPATHRGRNNECVCVSACVSVCVSVECVYPHMCIIKNCTF